MKKMSAKMKALSKKLGLPGKVARGAAGAAKAGARAAAKKPKGFMNY